MRQTVSKGLLECDNGVNDALEVKNTYCFVCIYICFFFYL